MDKKVVFALTGRRKAGKDTFAHRVMERFPSARQVAIADWFKETLSDIFEVPLKTFYDEKLKGTDFEKPFTITRARISQIAQKMESIDPAIDFNQYRTDLWQFQDRELINPRDMMEWFGFDFVASTYGEGFNCNQVSKRINEIQAPIVIVTDARAFAQSEFLVNSYGAIPIRITRIAGVSNADTSIEIATEQFPSGWFTHEIINPYPNINLYHNRIDAVINATVKW